MPILTLWCERCHSGFTFTSGDLPYRCGVCDRVTRWLTMPPPPPPVVPYVLTTNDRRLLRSLHIHAD